jgi:hypothetical protein
MRLYSSPHNRKLNIELRLAPQAQPENLYVRTRFFLDGHLIGDRDHAEPAIPLAASFRRIAENRTQRGANKFATSDPVQLYDELYTLLFVDDGAPDQIIGARWARYSPHLALPRGMEAFDDWIAFLVETESEEILVARRLSDPSDFAWSNLDLGEYESLLVEAAEALEPSN